MAEEDMPRPSEPLQPESYVPVCATVICEAPGVIYVSIDPDVWKIRCRQCQEKTEHKCALKKLKKKFRGDPSKRRPPKDPPAFGWREKEKEREKLREAKRANELRRKGSDIVPPEEPLPDNYCSCADRPRDVPPKPYVCLCEMYKPLNFAFELEVSGEFKPAHVPKVKKGK